MIQKVNRPAHLKLIGSSKSAENDPGSSQGSGMAYEHHEKPQNQEQSKEEERPHLAVVSELEKAGMTEVVKDFLEHKNMEPQAPSPGLTTARYQVDASPTKGLLLNKKAE